MVITDLVMKKCCNLWCDSRSKHIVNDGHHVQEVLPVLIINWDHVTNHDW